MSDEGLNQLRVAILRQAVNDYVKALIQDDGIRAYKIEWFFRSEWGELLSINNGDYIVTECKRRARRL